MLTFREIFWANLRRFREMAGLSQVELGLMIGYKSTGTISMIESGKRGMEIENIPQTAECVNVRPAALLKDHIMTDDEAECEVLLKAALDNNDRQKLAMMKAAMREAAKK